MKAQDVSASQIEASPADGEATAAQVVSPSQIETAQDQGKAIGKDFAETIPANTAASDVEVSAQAKIARATSD